MNLIATRRLTYGTRRLIAGDPFTTSNTDGRLLIAIKKAVAAPEKLDESGPPDVSAPVFEDRRRSSKRSKES